MMKSVNILHKSVIWHTMNRVYFYRVSVFRERPKNKRKILLLLRTQINSSEVSLYYKTFKMPAE